MGQCVGLGIGLLTRAAGPYLGMGVLSGAPGKVWPQGKHCGRPRAAAGSLGGRGEHLHWDVGVTSVGSHSAKMLPSPLEWTSHPSWLRGTWLCRKLAELFWGHMIILCLVFTVKRGLRTLTGGWLSAVQVQKHELLTSAESFPCGLFNPHDLRGAGHCFHPPCAGLGRE